MSATEDTSRLFRAMGLERKAGDYKDLGQLTRSSRIATLDESALPMMAAVARSLDAADTTPVPPAPVAAALPATAPASPLMASLAPEPATVHLVASPVPPVVAEPPAPVAARPAAANATLARVFERYGGKVETAPEVPTTGTSLKSLFDRLR